MDLSLQFGYGMMEHCKHLLKKWNGGIAVLSPRDLTDDQMDRLGTDIRKISGASIVIDPQFYLPRADHERLCAHDYWPASYSTGVFWQGPPLAELLKKLAALNSRLNSAAFILPGVLADQINDDWLASQEAIISEAVATHSSARLCATVALSAEAMRDPAQVAVLLERLESWQVRNYYVVCEHPKGDYLVDDPNWLTSVLDLIAGIRLLKRNVLLGYCNHQMLIASLSKVNAIASGTWMNVRSFPPDKFRINYDEEIKQRAVWYYCPQALSEYKIPSLDLAHRLGLLARMAPAPQFNSDYVTQLFAGGLPSSIGLTEQSAFRHYLQCLHHQCSLAEQSTFDDTLGFHEQTLDTAEALLRTLFPAGIRGQLRDFSHCLESNRSAIAAFRSIRGGMMRREWARIPSGVIFQ